MEAYTCLYIYKKKKKNHAHLIYQIICYLTQVQFTNGHNEFVEFWGVFPGQLPNLNDSSFLHPLCL